MKEETLGNWSFVIGPHLTHVHNHTEQLMLRAFSGQSLCKAQCDFVHDEHYNSFQLMIVA